VSDGPIHRHLRRLRGRVPGGPLRRRRILAELRAHLEDAADEEQQAGRPREDAERVAVERFGVPFPERRRRRATRIAVPAGVAVVVVAAVAAALASRGGGSTPRALSPAVPWASVPVCASAGSGPVPASTPVTRGSPHTRFLPCRPRPAVGTPRVAISVIGALPQGTGAVAQPAPRPSQG
jgi:hypothetical protein